MPSIHIAPSILAADFSRLGEQIEQINQTAARWIHVDVMDGRFVPNITMGQLVVSALKRVTARVLDVHLMVIEPNSMIESFAEAGATQLTVHYEVCADLFRTVTLIKRAGCAAGVAINPHTPVAMLLPILPLLNHVVVMTVSPGAGGQKLIPQTLPKIRELRDFANQMQPNLNIVIDGGVNVETLETVIRAGGNVLVAGASVFKDDAIVQNHAMLTQIAHQMTQI
ncbi:MAG UNVERIFIED_CONTAM: ribulose-phosphate 3-epimerase [Anaerolineae bacterium]|jgi:ribulose-phosphate 3-epimerase